MSLYAEQHHSYIYIYILRRPSSFVTRVHKKNEKSDKTFIRRRISRHIMQLSFRLAYQLIDGTSSRKRRRLTFKLFQVSVPKIAFDKRWQSFDSQKCKLSLMQALQHKNSREKDDIFSIGLIPIFIDPLFCKTSNYFLFCQKS